MNNLTGKKTQPALLLALLVVTSLAYLPGLSGPFMFDDLANLQPIERWQSGAIGWQQVVLGNESGPLGRPLSMLSFVVSAALSDGSPWGDSYAWSFKLGNLLLHLATGLLLYVLFMRLAHLDQAFADEPALLALVLAAIWLLHPMLVSTVLYVVQRMAMLSTLFMVAAMLAYIHGRSLLHRGSTTPALWWMFPGVLALTALAAFSKENGLLALLLCGVLELAYFRPAPGLRRPLAARVFLLLFVAVPIAAALVLLLLAPEFYLGGYANRAFSVTERLLTQPMVLWDYVGSLLLPNGAEFSLYRDDYPIASGLLKPPGTLLAILGWLAVVAAAVKLRSRLPSFSAGIGLFLVGHSMESSIFPLLIYFEHRNYLPAIGLLLALGSLQVAAANGLRSQLSERAPMLAKMALLALIVVLAGATFARAGIWQSKELLVQQSLENHPASRFIRMEAANMDMNKNPPRADLAREHYRFLARQERSSTRFIGGLGLLAVDCFVDNATSPAAVARPFAEQPESFEADVMKAVRSLASIVAATDCDNLDAETYASQLAIMADWLQQNRPIDPWQLRYHAARLFNGAGNIEAALAQAEAAWASDNAELPVGMMMVGFRLALGRYQAAEALLNELEPQLPRDDKTAQKLLREYREALNKQFADSILDNN